MESVPGSAVTLDPSLGHLTVPSSAGGVQCAKAETESVTETHAGATRVRMIDVVVIAV